MAEETKNQNLTITCLPPTTIGTSGATGATGVAGFNPAGFKTYTGPAAWSEHIFYEATMLHQVRDLWMRLLGIHVPLSDEETVVLRNTLVESFLVHVRNLIEFFREEKSAWGHVHIDDFLGNQQAAKWRAKHLDETIKKKLNDHWTFVSTHLSHPSRERTHNGQDREVKMDELVSFFDSIMKAFVNAGGVESKLSSNVDWSRWRKV